MICAPLSSSSSSSAAGAPPLIPPNAACFPARENGLDRTAVPNTLADVGAPKVAKSVTTFRGGETAGDVKPEPGGVRGGLSGMRGGIAGAYEWE